MVSSARLAFGVARVSVSVGFHGANGFFNSRRMVHTMGSSQRYIDIGANLLDRMYRGEYHGKEYHAVDLNKVLERSWRAGVDKILVTAGTLDEAKDALQLCRQHERLYMTVGVHPTRGNEWASYSNGGPEAYMKELEAVIEQALGECKVVAVGECGLDYDRLEFCDADVQKACFREHFKLSKKYNLPMFLHSRATGGDMVSFLKEYHSMMPKGGVVHSFDGSYEEMQELVDIEGIYIGINGCSLKTEENLSVVAQIPMDKLMLETDAPWCGLRPSHASSAHVKTVIQAKDKKKHDMVSQVKGRNEPCNICQVCEVVASVKGLSVEDVSAKAYANTMDLFFT